MPRIYMIFKDYVYYGQSFKDLNDTSPSDQRYYNKYYIYNLNYILKVFACL